jgi:hypothetical protein
MGKRSQAKPESTNHGDKHGKSEHNLTHSIISQEMTFDHKYYGIFDESLHSQNGGDIPASGTEWRLS